MLLLIYVNFYLIAVMSYKCVFQLVGLPFDSPCGLLNFAVQ